MSFLIAYGLMGLFIASFLAATILPFSSEAVLAGLATQEFDTTQLLIFASLGNWLGGLTSYYLGYFAKWTWLEKWFRVTKEQLDEIAVRFNRFGMYSAFLCWLPFVGDPLAVALGLSRAKILPVAIFMLMGKALRYAVVLWGTSVVMQ